MNELIQKIIEAGKKDALQSPEALRETAMELGFSADDVAAVMESLDSFPLSEDELNVVAGGLAPRSDLIGKIKHTEHL